MKKFIFSLLATVGLVAGAAQAEVYNAQDTRPAKELVVFETDKGSFVISLRGDKAPKHVANFKKLVQEGFYDGLFWHRVIPNFVAQAGDPTLVGRAKPNYTIEAEFNNGLMHTRGAVAAARIGDPRGEPERAEYLNSASTQFYICFRKQDYLDGRYSVFGYVDQGMEIVDQLERGDKIVKAYMLSGS